MARRNDHTREELTELIISATESLLSEKPVEDVSARSIAKAIGYTVGTLYTVFDNLPALYVAVNERTLLQLHHSCQGAMQKARSPRRRIRALGTSYLAFAQAQPHRFNLMFHVIVMGAGETESLAERIDGLFDLIRAELRRLSAQLEQERSAGAIDLAAHALWSGVHGVTMLKLTDQLFSPIVHADERLIHSIIDNYLEGWQRVG